MLASQFILSVIILYIVYRTVLTAQKKNLARGFLFLWLIFWLVALFFVLSPNILSGLAALLGIGRGVDLAVYLAIIALFYLVFKLYTSLSELNRKLTHIIRKIALDEQEPE